MAGTITRKRPRTTTKVRRENRTSVNERYLVDANGKRVAVVLPLEDYQRLMAGERKPAQMSAAERAKLVKLALRAAGSWKEHEGTGTAVEIVRRLRDEWER